MYQGGEIMAKKETVDMSPKMAVSKRIHPKIRVCLAADDIFFGPGAAELIELIETTGSLHEACSRMGLSYSKGRYIVKRLEEQLGMPVVRRWAGGVGGGGAVLTDEGRQLLGAYREFALKVNKTADEIFKECFTHD